MCYFGMHYPEMDTGALVVGLLDRDIITSSPRDKYISVNGYIID